ncbi:MAG: hypothetical protein HZA04_01010 [Nitrospinae bacterium]|nr:hypothetical protein [Nitrospinota bacterium]
MSLPVNDHAFARARARINREEFIYSVLSVVFFLIALLVYTYPSVQMVHLVYHEQQVKAEERKLMAEQSRLRLQLEMMMAPGEMEARAINGGFGVPSAPQVVFVSKR